jgi:hypothetical protein
VYNSTMLQIKPKYVSPKARLILVIPPAIKTVLRDLAEREGKSLNVLCCELIGRGLRDKLGGEL